jgi:hypothetical protein
VICCDLGEEWICSENGGNLEAEVCITVPSLASGDRWLFKWMR